MLYISQWLSHCVMYIIYQQYDSQKLNFNKKFLIFIADCSENALMKWVTTKPPLKATTFSSSSFFLSAPEQNGQWLADDIFRWIFLTGYYLLYSDSASEVCSSLVQVMSQHQTGTMPFSTKDDAIFCCLYVSPVLISSVLTQKRLAYERICKVLTE